MGLYLLLTDADRELLEKETRDYNEQHNVALSRQKFLIKLLKDYATRKEAIEVPGHQ